MIDGELVQLDEAVALGAGRVDVEVLPRAAVVEQVGVRLADSRGR